MYRNKLETIMFLHGAAKFTALQAVVTAIVQGEFQYFAQSIANGEVCRQYAEAHGQEIDDATLQAASESYRKSAGLASAQATADWLESRSLTLDDFIDYLDRDLCRQRFEDAIEESTLDDKQLLDLLWPELIFTGILDQYANSLAQRVAVAAQNNVPVAAEPIPDEITTWLTLLGATPEAAAECAAREQCFTLALQQHVSPDRLRRELDHRRLEFLRVRVESLNFASEHVANEVYLCISEEGVSLENFCAATSSPAYCYSALLSELPREIQGRLLSAAPGQVFPPTLSDGEYIIHRLRHKSDPDLGDAMTRQRLEQDLCAKYVEGLVEKHIDWIVR